MTDAKTKLLLNRMCDNIAAGALEATDPSERLYLLVTQLCICRQQMTKLFPGQTEQEYEKALFMITRLVISRLGIVLSVSEPKGSA